MNVLFNGFATAAVTGLVESFVDEQRIATVYWIRDNLGEDRRISNVRLKVIDHQAALSLAVRVMPDVSRAAVWSDRLLQLYEAIKPVVLKMQDRLDRYGPAVSYTQRETTLRRQFNYWLSFLRERQIGAFVTSNVPHEITDYIIYELCLVLGIKTVFFYQWTPDVLLPLNRLEDFGDQSCQLAVSLGQEERALVAASEERIYAKYIEGKESKPFYMNKAVVNKYKRKRDRHWGKRGLTKIKGDWRRLFSATGLRYAWYTLVERKLLRQRADTAFRNQYAAIADKAPNLERKYIYLALHYQPEATTSPLGGIFVDQYLMVDVLLAAFPEEVSVYVKEHPAQGMIGRGKDYYALFVDSPRVHFIATDVSSLSLQNNALAVATVTGTVGFESIWSNTPVLVFGHTYYLGGPRTYAITTIEDGRQAARQLVVEDNALPPESATEFTHRLLSRTLPANCDGPYQDNSVIGLTVDHNVRLIRREVLARITAPVPPPA